MNDKTKPEAQAAGVDEVLEVVAKYVGRTSNIFGYIRDDLKGTFKAALSTPASHDAQQPTNWLAELREGADYWREKCSILQQRLDALDAQQPVREEMSPDFTDSARAAIAWVLYHHQGGSSPVGQPLRFALGMGAHEPLPDWRIAEAKAWAEWASATTADFHAQQPAVVGDGAWAEPDMQRPWGAESAFLRHLADDSALNAAQSMMLRHCAKRIESTADIHLRALAEMLDPAKQAGVLREAADAITPAATPGADLVGEDGLRLPTLDGFLGLNPDTLALVRRFAYALACKLSVAEQKYGYTDGWKSPDWMDECRQKLVEHVAKGDPRDVAAYCAFLWHHGESTAATPRPACPDCKGTGGEWWMEADGSENGRKCDTCDGFGSVAMPCSKCADLDRANKQLHDHGTAMYAQLTALRSALVEYPKKNPQQMQAAKVCAGVEKLAAQKEGNGNG